MYNWETVQHISLRKVQFINSSWQVTFSFKKFVLTFNRVAMQVALTTQFSIRWKRSKFLFAINHNEKSYEKDCIYHLPHGFCVEIIIESFYPKNMRTTIHFLLLPAIYNISSSFIRDKKEKVPHSLATLFDDGKKFEWKLPSEMKTGVRLHDNNITKYCSRLTSPLKLQNNRNFNIIQELLWLRGRKLFELDSEFDE